MAFSDNVDWLNQEIATHSKPGVRTIQEAEESAFRHHDTEDRSEIFKQILLSSVRLRSAEIKHVSLSTKFLYIITSDNQALRWELDEQEKLKEPKKESMEELIIRASSLEMTKVFCDPTGFHTLISMSSNDTHYIHETTTKSSLLAKLRGLKIETVCFNKKCDYYQTREILLGTDQGIIYELCLEYDKVTDGVKNVSLTKLIELPYVAEVFGLQYEIYPGAPGKVLIMVATANHLYQFIGDANDQRRADFNKILEKYRANESLIEASVHQVNGLFSKGQLQFYYDRSRADSFAWLNATGLMYGKFVSSAVEDIFVSKMVPVPFPPSIFSIEEIIGIGITAYYCYFLLKKTLLVYSKLSQDLVHKVEFDLRGGAELKGIFFDLETHSLVIYSNRFVYKVQVENEKKDVWKYYVDQGLYEEAVDFCKKIESPYIPKVNGLYADHLYKKGQLLQAAEAFADSDKNFEEVCLKLVDNSAALQKFLETQLKLINNDQKTQRTLVTTWLAEVYLYNINCVYITDEEARISVEEDFRTFLSLHHHDLDAVTTYTLLQTHGRIDDWVYFAELKGNFEMVILHHMNQQEFSKALIKLEHVDSASKENLLHRYSPIFMQHEPELTVRLLMETAMERRGIPDIKRLIPGLLNVPMELREFAINFEFFCVDSLGMKEKSLHNLLIFHLAETNSPLLIKYIQDQELHEEFSFDTEYALTVFKQNNCVEALISLYGRMGLQSEAVSIALEYGKIDLAKENAQKLETIDEGLARRVWLKIAISFIKSKTGDQKKNIESALQLMNESKLIKMEDLLPYFEDDASISNFNDELCSALNEYKESILELQEDLTHSKKSREVVRDEILTAKHAYIEVEVLKLCEICGKPAVCKSFYIYPCVHAYHKKCLMKVLLPMLELRDWVRAKEIRSLKEKLKTLTLNEGESHPLEEKLDKLLATNCYLCSNWFIESIKDNMLDNAFEIDSWGIN